MGVAGGAAGVGAAAAIEPSTVTTPEDLAAV
jgi:hypothetical protein